MVYSTRRFVLCLTLCLFYFVFCSPFSIAITSLGEDRANLSSFRTCVRFVLIWFCLFPLPLGAWEGLRFVIVALPGLFSYLFFFFFFFLFHYHGGKGGKVARNLDIYHFMSVSQRGTRPLLRIFVGNTNKYLKESNNRSEYVYS